MAEGGFLVKFDNKKTLRCYSIAFDYDEWAYTMNNTKKQKLPPQLKKINIEMEEE